MRNLRGEYRQIILWAVVSLLVVNGFSWQPGYGGRVDGRPGYELERYFGWPACFYCDLRRSDRNNGIALPLYFPAVPLDSELKLVYGSWSGLAALINLTVVACLTGICLILVSMENEDLSRKRLAAAIALASICLGLIWYGDEFNAYL